MRWTRPWDTSGVVVAVAVLLSLTVDTTPVHACGGPDHAELGVLQPLGSAIERIVQEDPYWGTWGQQRHDEMRFLYPLVRAYPLELRGLWEFAYDGKGELPGPTVATFQEAVVDGNDARAEEEAHRIVDAFLALPAPVAAQHSRPFWSAVEYLELLPELRKIPRDMVREFLTSDLESAPPGWPDILREALGVRQTQANGKRAAPATSTRVVRAGSLEYWAMQFELRTRVPDGWADAVRRQVPAPTWQQLQSRADTWLHRFPNHPLADLVRLWTVRIQYFAGNSASAWQVVLDMYPRHRPRVLSEMRYLLLQRTAPSREQIGAIRDPALLAALANEVPMDVARWQRLWALSEAQPQSPWATNLQERLLLWAARNAGPGGLPPAFPSHPTNPSRMWGTLRAIALMKADRWTAASAELASLPTDQLQAQLLAQVHLLQGHADDALGVAGLESSSREYLARVRASSAGLRRWTGAADQEVRKAARLELGVREASRGAWLDAAHVVEPEDPTRAALWRAAGAWHSDPAKRLELARFFREHARELLYPEDRAWYRSVSLVYDRSEPRERQAIERAMTQGSARWMALEAYAQWLEANPGHRDARDVLAEADGVYNGLIHWAGDRNYFWGKYAPASRAAQTLRNAGRKIRAQRR